MHFVPHANQPASQENAGVVAAARNRPIKIICLVIMENGLPSAPGWATRTITRISFFI
jgi:hypothetical protein